MKIQHCTLIFLIRHKNVLLAMKKRGFGKGRWNGPGGKVEMGESDEMAMIRECQEEIGITPLDCVKVAVHKFYYNGEHGKQLVIAHVYTSSRWKGEPVETEEMAPQWFRFEDIPYETMWDDDQYWLPEVLEGKKIVGEFTFDHNDKMLTKEIRVVTDKELANVKI